MAQTELTARTWQGHTPRKAHKKSFALFAASAMYNLRSGFETQSGCKAFVRIRTHAAHGRTFARNFVRTVISFSRPAPAPCYSTILGRGDLPRYAESGVLQRIRGDLSPPSSTRSPRLDNARTFQRRHRDNARHIQGSRQAASRRAIRKARRRKTARKPSPSPPAVSY